ncbi:MAG: AAA family ATPase [Coprococcus sp.]|nr:AAA family ATPase [Coprococcus sp.]
MIKNSIYDQVRGFVKTRFKDRPLVALQLLYGYAKLVSMNSGVLSVLFAKEEEQEELNEISVVFDENKIDVELVKSGVPLLLANRDNVKEAEELRVVLEEIVDDSLNHSSVELLTQLFRLDIPELYLVKKGQSIDDILNYVDSIHSSKVNDEEAATLQAAEADSADNTDAQQDTQTLEPKTDEPIGDKSVEPDKEAKTTVRSSESGEEAKVAEKSALPDKESKVVSQADGKKNTAVDDIISKRDRFASLINKTKRLSNRLNCKIMGQAEAVRMFCDGYFQSEVLKDADKDQTGPSATFLFAGPSGVGKTFLASTAAQMLDMPFLRLDMSEYYSDNSVHVLTGVPKTYASPKPGTLTKFVSKNPRSVILFDEIEKAGESVLFQFLQVLDGGSLTDSYTEESVDFTQTILIFTTNVGKSLYEERDRDNLSAIPKSVVIKAIEQEKDEYGHSKIPAAMCSRFASGNIIMFNHLGVDSLIDIANDRFGVYTRKINKLYDYNVEIDEKLSSVLLFSQSSSMDARNISAQSLIMLKNELYEFGRHVPAPEASLNTLEKLKFCVDTSKSSKEIQDLFSNDSAADILFIGDAKDLEDVPVSTRCIIHVAPDRNKAKSIIANNNIEYVIVDPLYNVEDANSDYLSLDDRKSEGIYTFEEIKDSFPQLPVYILEKEVIGSEDKLQLIEKGARDFVKMDSKLEFSDRILHISDMIYLQKKVDDLSEHGRVLNFNTAQHFTDDGKTAELIYYDFRIQLATDADENKMMAGKGEIPDVSFDDIIGAEYAKEELQFIISQMKDSKRQLAKGYKPPKGILLYGPPGTGKTMLAKAMAAQSKASFFPTTAAQFQNKYVGEGERTIRELFKTARKFAPSIIFIDEIDAIGKERTGSASTHHTETLLNTLLTEMDGFKVDITKPVLVVAATNYDLDGSVSGKASSIDPALLRRFDNRILVNLPKEEDRRKYLKLKLGRMKLDKISDTAIESIAQRTTGESLAILENIINLAVRNAGKKGKEPDDNFLLEALEEYMYGEKKDWGKEYYQNVARHEAGHAYICHLSGEKPSFVTIVSRGNFGGYMQHANSENIPQYTKQQMLWNIKTSLAGRAAELEFYGEESGINTGVSSDLEHATRLAMDMVCKYGMQKGRLISCSPEIILNSGRAAQFLDEINDILSEQMEETRALIRGGKDKVERLAQFLLDNNQAIESEIQDIFNA